MNGQELSTALRSGQRVYGTAVLSTSARWPRVVQKLGLDFVFIDTEHTPIDREKLAWMCQTYDALGLAPLVRIPEPDPYQACVVLDGGAKGVIAPYVETVQEVQALRGAVKLRPLKGRRLRQALTGEADLPADLAAYLDRWNTGNVLIINIESRPALEALDDILAVPQLDAVLIGPHDLSISLGLPEQYHQPLFDETIKTIIRKARQHEVGVGIHFSTGRDQEIEWAKAGANFIVHSSDLTLFSQALAADLTVMKEALGAASLPGGQHGEDII
ncbi:MAG: aldolase [Anaerolineae bacterium]|nr:aldolase [Anaerolineae bacterium]